MAEPSRDAGRNRRTYLRVGFVAVLLLLSVPVAGDYLSASPGAASPSPSAEALPSSAVQGITVVTIDALGPGQIVAFGPDGATLYRNRTYPIYHDVDPSPAGATSVMYVASDLGVPADACDGDSCIRNVVERVNLTTGNVTRLYSRVRPYQGSSQVHDVDRVNDSVLLVGDIGPPDRVYMVDTSTDEVIWEWRVSEAYAPSSGGQYPGDWTHLNDVEYLDDGRVMVNLRNQDQVVFVEPGEGVNDSWTLGRDDAYGVLYEPHNPDYIPRENGGPAVLIADSENNRLVEYQRTDGNWTRSWRWRATGLQWPRDADRLPNGNTLVVDSHGQRLLEVDRTGEVVWERPFPDGGYDAERLGTGDESTGGQSMHSLEPADANTRTGNVCGSLPGCTAYAFVSVIPSIVLHGVLYSLPTWVTPLGGAAVIYGVFVGACWGVGEAFLFLRG